MKHFTKILSLCLALMLCLSCVPAAFAAKVEDATIKVNMVEDNGSKNAEAPLTVVNTRGFDLPKTGDNGTFVFTAGGILLMACAAGVLYIATRKKRSV